MNKTRLIIIEKDNFLREEIIDYFSYENKFLIKDQKNIKNFSTFYDNFQPEIFILGSYFNYDNNTNIKKLLMSKILYTDIFILAYKNELSRLKNLFTNSKIKIVQKPILISDLYKDVINTLNYSFKKFYFFDEVEFIPNKKIIKKENEQVELTNKENLILLHLIQSNEVKISTEEIIKNVWKDRENISNHNLNTHIYRLRRKIKKITDKEIIYYCSKGFYILKFKI